MGNTAKLRHLRLAPRKVRAIADIVRGKQVEEALATLKFTTKAAAKPVAKLIRSAISNADQAAGGNLDVDRLYIKSIFVDQGPTLRRFLSRAMGRATRLNKKTSHVTVELAERA